MQIYDSLLYEQDSPENLRYLGPNREDTHSCKYGISSKMVHVYLKLKIVVARLRRLFQILLFPLLLYGPEVGLLCDS